MILLNDVCLYRMEGIYTVWRETFAGENFGGEFGDLLPKFNPLITCSSSD